MTLHQNGDRFMVFDGPDMLASVRIVRPLDDLRMPLIIMDLEGTGSAGAMRMLIERIIQMAENEPIYASVMYSNPKHDQLVRHYRRLGMKLDNTTLVIGGK